MAWVPVLWTGRNESVIFALGSMLPWVLFVILCVAWVGISMSQCWRLGCAGAPGRGSTNQAGCEVWAVCAEGEGVPRRTWSTLQPSAGTSFYPLFRPCLLCCNVCNLSFFTSTPSTRSVLNHTVSVHHSCVENTFEKIFDCIHMIEFLLLLCTFVPKVWRYSLQLTFCRFAPGLCRVCVYLLKYSS